MHSLLTFAFIGGDKRQIYTSMLLANEGYRVKTYGLEKSDETCMCTYSAEECIKNADVVVLPMPYSKDKVNVNAPFASKQISVSDIVSSVKKDAVIFVGIADRTFDDLCSVAGVKYVDYGKREELAIMNAVPTAEGALMIATENTKHTIHSSKCLVIGYGRIGKILSSYLKALGADVVAAARKSADIALIKVMGIRSALTSELSNGIESYDIIFNTVPNLILDFSLLHKTDPNVLIIDLASKPGGVDLDTAKALNRKAIWALSLPGKTAPYTAGKIIKDTMLNILEEMEV